MYAPYDRGSCSTSTSASGTWSVYRRALTLQYRSGGRYGANDSLKFARGVRSSSIPVCTYNVHLPYIPGILLPDTHCVQYVSRL